MPRRQQPRRRASQRPIFGVGNAAVGRRSSGMKMRLLMALAIAAFALISYYGNPGDVNRVTGESERVAFAEEADEMKLGLQAKPEMVAQHGGESRDRQKCLRVEQTGRELLLALQAWIDAQPTEPRAEERGIPYRFDFTLLADPRTVNAFALPGGQVFITEALYDRLDVRGGNAELAGVIGHEIGHVIERHGNKRMAKQKLFSGLATAGGVAGGDVQSQQTAQMIANMVSMKYGREDELESDLWGVRLLAAAGYDPRAMIGVMKVLDEAGGGGGPPEMLSTHPKPANRIEYIQQVIRAEFPNGLPRGLRL
ncbi:MAG: M48 family metallopeptidase [Planctomycetota bacterium]